MSGLNIVYFPARGRAETARLVLAAAGVDWTETHVTGETMPEWKASGKLAFGQVPLLQDGDLNLVQSNTIARYLARKYDLYGDEKVGAIGDMIIDGHNDLLNKLIPALFPKPDPEKIAALKADTVPVFMKFFEKIVADYADSGFLGGDKLSLGDLSLFLISESYIDDNQLVAASDYPKLVAHKERVAANENVAKYIKGDKRHPARKFT